MCEGRSDQWRFPLLSSAQQQMGRGCGLVGWLTRIMNLPVVLFNTKKGKQKHKQQSRLAFIETVDTSNQETNWSSTGVCSTCHNNLFSLRITNLKSTCVNERIVSKLCATFLAMVGWTYKNYLFILSSLNRVTKSVCHMYVVSPLVTRTNTKTH